MANYSGLSNNDPGSVIDKKELSNLSARMDIDPGLGVGKLRDHARQERDSLRVQLMGHAVNHDGKDTRIAEDNLVVAF